MHCLSSFLQEHLFKLVIMGHQDYVVVKTFFLGQNTQCPNKQLLPDLETPITHAHKSCLKLTQMQKDWFHNASASGRLQLHRSHGQGQRWRGEGWGFTGNMRREGMLSSVGGQVPGFSGLFNFMVSGKSSGSAVSLLVR